MSVRPFDTTNVVVLMGFFFSPSLGIFAGVTLTGIGSTLLLDETMDRSLEQLSRERQQDFIHGMSISRI